MLVLTRNVNERIVIGTDIRITVALIQGNQVRLGIEAPRQVKVLRSELVPTGARPPVVAGDQTGRMGDRGNGRSA